MFAYIAYTLCHKTRPKVYRFGFRDKQKDKDKKKKDKRIKKAKRIKKTKRIKDIRKKDKRKKDQRQTLWEKIDR